jgi:hypothetical protein
MNLQICVPYEKCVFNKGIIMKKILKWQKVIVDEERKMKNQELYDTVLFLGQFDEPDNKIDSNRHYWEYEYLEKKLKERLVGFFNESLSQKPISASWDGILYDGNFAENNNKDTKNLKNRWLIKTINQT